MKVISLFDKTGVMVGPWFEAGYDCWVVDLAHAESGIREDGVNVVRADLSGHWLPPFDKSEIAFVAAFPPCDHLAVSGARWFAGKGLRSLSSAINLFATAAEFCEWSGAPYMIENPVSTISTYWRKPDYTFSPHHYSAYCPYDNYNKKTCLWVGGGFVMPQKSIDHGLGQPDCRIHTMPPSDDRAAMRSVTPAGFAKAVFMANHRQIAAAS